jgi:glycosyltransferase involved in cell wall biosynthesis
MSAEPLISVIAPAHNAVSFYDRWIGSLLAQNYPNLEIVLVDDGSADGLAARAQAGPPFLRYIRQENRGPAAARNTGIAAAGGELIAFLDLDDLWEPGHLKRMAAALVEAPHAYIAQGLIRNFCYGEDGCAYYCSRAYRFINLGSAVFRRSVFDYCGVLEEQMRFGEDFDFLIRCWEQGMVKRDVNEVSLYYHRHAANMTHGKTPMEMGAVAIYKRHLDRLRSGRTDAGGRCPGADFAQYIGRNVFPFDEGIREPVQHAI